MSSVQGLNQRTQGWLRFIWDKAITQDDWSSSGEPLPWWDRTTTPPMCSFPRFDLSETSYALPLMADQTPAWREVYTRIAGRSLCYILGGGRLADPHRPRSPSRSISAL